VDTFAFIIHPIDPKRDVSRKFPLLGKALSERQIDFFSTFFPPVYISEITGIRSESSGKEIKGWFVACPLTPTRMMELPLKTAYRKIIQTGRMAERLGAGMLGLGAFTSVVGDGGISVARALEIPVTTGDSYTIAVALQALRKAAGVMGIHMPQATAAVVGATGAIGRVCADILAREVAELHLVGKRQPALAELQRELLDSGASARLHISTGLEGLRQSQLVLTVTSSKKAIVQPEHLQPGCVVCDVARPRDVSAQVAAQRPDILVIDGGMVEVPGQVNFNFDFGFPPGKAYACMAETMALTLEGRLEDYTLGKKITRSQVNEISAIAGRHGFKLSGFRSFERAVSQIKIERVRQLARAGV
jgi:fatty aldehyde-generating acyl-ACP reductase